MSRRSGVTTAVVVLLALSACSANDDDSMVDAASVNGENLLPGEEAGDQTSMPAPGEGDTPDPFIDPVPSSDDTRAVAGLWDAGIGEVVRRDERYVEISQNGLYTLYNFGQDAVDDFGNCHEVTPMRLDVEFAPDGATPGSYSTADGMSFTASVETGPDGATLVVAFEGELDQQRWPAYTDAGVDSFVICDEP